MPDIMQDWNIIIYLLIIGVLLFVGKALKNVFPFLNKIVIPTALLGGTIGLAVTLIVNGIAPGTLDVDVDMTNAIVYHALALGFIALTLKKDENKNKRKAWSTGMIITSTYALQGFLGIVIVMVLFSGVSIAAGMLLPLGFGQGPALAMSFGNSWTEMLAGQGRALGASFAFLGFMWGGIVGVIAINFIARKKGFVKPDTYLDVAVQKTTIEVDSVREISVLDGLTVQIVIISIIYALVWLTILGFKALLYSPDGGIGNTVFGLIKSFNFIIGIAYALIYKQILKALEKKGKNVGFMTNNYLLSNISSTCFNYMIAGAVLTITIDFLADYGWLLVIVSTVGGIATLFYMRFITKRVYPQFKDEYFVGLYGMLTGVASTGVALLKGLDRQLQTPVAEDLVLGSGTAMIMALPLFAILMLPSIGYGQSYAGIFDYIVLFGCLAYTVVMTVLLLIRARRKPIAIEKVAK